MPVVAEIMRREPIHTVSPDDTLRSAAERMSRARIGSLVVLEDGGRLAGIITERDLVRSMSDGADPDSTPVRSYMSTKLIVARPEDSIVSAAHKMIAHGIRHLPVVDSSGRLVGIVSMRDVLRSLVGEHEFP